MKIVITNDDGYGEPGLIALYDALQSMGEVIVVAPEGPQSGVGHSVTLKGAISVDRIEDNNYIVHGFPADCVRLALKEFSPEADWLISGINPGANLGTDVYPSGTVGAAREAAILGYKSIAVSQYIARGHSIDWRITGYHASRILPRIMQLPLSPGQFWNINLPHPLDLDTTPDYEICPVEKNPQKYQFIKNSAAYGYAGSIHDRPRVPGSDVAVCFGGRISVSRLKI